MVLNIIDLVEHEDKPGAVLLGSIDPLLDVVKGGVAVDGLYFKRVLICICVIEAYVGGAGTTIKVSFLECVFFSC